MTNVENGEMSTVIIERERGKPAEPLDFIAWKDDRRAFYAKPHNGKPHVVTLIPALPDGAEWTSEPFQECAPVKITPCRLLPPPCRGSADEWKIALPNEWEAVYLKAHDQELHLASNDDKPLQERLAAYKDVVRAYYKEDMEAVWRLTDHEELTQRYVSIENKYNRPLGRYHGTETAGILNLTLDMVKRGCGELSGELPGRMCIRDIYLVAELWAKREGIDLSEMDLEREKFWQWIKTYAGQPAIINKISMMDKQRGFIPLRFHGNLDPRFLVLCAGVRFCVEFENGSAAYLTGCELRPLRPVELAEAQSLSIDLSGPSKRLSEQRAKAAKANRSVKNKDDRATIKFAVLRKINNTYTHNQANEEVARLCENPENLLDLKEGPYFITARTVRRITHGK